MSFENKVVLITGGSAGIGAAVAIKLSTQRAKIAIVARNEKKLVEVSEICERNGSKPLVIIADVTKDEDARRIVSDTIKHYGKLDVLVNNVGIFRCISIADPKAMEMFDHMMTTNLRSAVHLTHLSVPHLVETGGNIVNISSAGAKAVLFPENFTYCSSKAAMDHFSRSVALELAPKGVRVNCVNPGPVVTSCLENSSLDQAAQDAIWDNARRQTALGKLSDPEEIANVVLFLASDTAKSITGSTYVIDNGMLLKGMCG